MPKITQVKHPPKLNQKKKVAAYCRVSSGKDAMLHSLSAQVSYYSDLIQKTDGWEYVGVYADEAITGTKEDRPDFQRMIADCLEGKFDILLTKSISRFARNTVTLLKTVRLLKAYGVDIYFEEENMHTSSADGELLITIIASYAQEESRSASENQKWRIKKNFEDGIPWNAHILGYKLKNGQFVVVPEKAAIVKRIYKEYLDGAGLTQIAKGLDSDGILPLRGGLWNPNTIRRILQNYNYTGNLLLQKTFRENHITKKKIMNKGQLPMYHATDTHEAIIDLETFQKVQLENKRRAEIYAPKKSTTNRYQYSSKVVCAKCGKKYRRKITQTQVVWICSTFNNHGKAFCSSKQIPESVLDSMVAEIPGGIENIDYIVADENNTLHIHFYDSAVKDFTWADRSRSESWTADKREKASQKAYERSANNGKSNNSNSCYQE